MQLHSLKYFFRNKRYHNINIKDCHNLNDILKKIGKISRMKKLSKGVRVDVDDDEIIIDLSIIIRMGENIVKVSKKVQEKVKDTIENMTCMKVVNINVNISNVENE